MGQHGDRRRCAEAAPRRALMLGFRNFAEVSLAPKMAESPQQVIAFLEDLATRARPHADRTGTSCARSPRRNSASPNSRRGDVAFAASCASSAMRSRKTRSSSTSRSRPRSRGLFTVTETLFGVQIKPDDAPVWHKDVRFFRVENRDGSLVAQFYRPVRAREASAAAHGWTTRVRAKRGSSVRRRSPISPATSRRRSAQARLLHARRSHHAVP